MSTIAPTIGRSLHYFLANHAPGFAGSGGELYAALLCGVNADDNINLCVFDRVGRPFPKENVRLVQDGDTPPAGDYARWVAYQTGQAPASYALLARIDTLEHTLRGLDAVVGSILALLTKRTEAELRSFDHKAVSLGLVHPPVEATTLAASDVGTLESLGLGVGAPGGFAATPKQE